MTQPAITMAREPTMSSARIAGMFALVASIGGLLLCGLMAFGLLALPVLGPLHLYDFIGLHDLDMLALIVGLPGPLPAVVGVALGYWARRAEKKRGEPTLLATLAITLGLVALVVTGLGWGANEYVAQHGHLF